MATFLFNDIVFGPIKSRRLGNSLGVNLLPNNKKYCNFDCIYCECGLNSENSEIKPLLPSSAQVIKLLKKKLEELVTDKNIPDVITFAGNGEPTLHPDFPELIEKVIHTRDKIVPNVKIAVLSNATSIHKPSVANALKKIDYNILKLDSGIEKTLLKINRPSFPLSLENLITYFKTFDNLIVQTMFLKGKINGEVVDNTTKTEIQAWLRVLSQIKPKLVMIYSIDRDTPYDSLLKVKNKKLEEIALFVKMLALEVNISS